jgi:shikimate dehydrogenase
MVGLINMDNTNTAVYGVVGNPISHSKSPSIHQSFALQTKQDISYKPFLVEVGGFERAITNFITSGVSGLNVTVPFKEDAWAIATKLSQQAQLAGAVNTLSFKDGEILGDNTDGVGLVSDLKNNHGFDFAGKKVLVLGAGGAVRGVLGPIIQENPASITIANRTLSKAQQLEQIFANDFSISSSEYGDLDTSYDLIINGTSASLNNELPPIPEVVVGAHSVLYDMMYSQQTTAFNQWGQGLNASSTIDGLGMLVEQAAEAFYIWRGIRPVTSDVFSKFRSK